MPTPELVIFDCDGVLVDSEGISNRVLAAMLVREGLSISPEQTRAEYQGSQLADVLARVEQRLGRRLPDDWLACFQRERAEEFRRELKPVSGAAEAVEHVQRAGLGVCVASQAGLAKTRLTLSLTGLERWFPEAVRFSADSVPRGKPAPDLFLHAARTMGADPAACVVVEDTASGITAARAAGMRALGFAADSDKAALAGAGAEVFYELRELPELLAVG